MPILAFASLTKPFQSFLLPLFSYCRWINGTAMSQYQCSAAGCRCAGSKLTKKSCTLTRSSQQASQVTNPGISLFLVRNHLTPAVPLAPSTPLQSGIPERLRIQVSAASKEPVARASGKRRFCSRGLLKRQTLALPSARRAHWKEE